MGPLFLSRAGRVFVDMEAFFFTEKGLKGPTTAGPVKGFVFWPVGVPAIEVTEFHKQSLIP